MSGSGRPKVPIPPVSGSGRHRSEARGAESVARVSARADAEAGEPARRGHPDGRDVIDHCAGGSAPEDLLDLADRGAGTLDHAPKAAVRLVGDPAGQAALGGPTQQVVAEA